MTQTLPKQDSWSSSEGTAPPVHFYPAPAGIEEASDRFSH